MTDALRCPRDGQSVEWHLAIAGTHPNGAPRTNGEFVGCDFGTSPSDLYQRGYDAGVDQERASIAKQLRRLPNNERLAWVEGFIRGYALTRGDATDD